MKIYLLIYFALLFNAIFSATKDECADIFQICLDNCVRHSTGSPYIVYCFKRCSDQNSECNAKAEGNTVNTAKN